MVVSTAAEGERYRAHESRRPGSDAQCFGDAQYSPAPDREQHRPPQPLGQPAGHAEGMAQGEERSVREKIAVSLVLGLAEGKVAVPEVGRPGQEAQWVGGQIQFGIRGDQSR